MNELYLKHIYDDIFLNCEIHKTDLYDNEVFNTLEYLILDMYKEFNTIENIDTLKKKINTIIKQEQNSVESPIYDVSTLLYLENHIKHLETIPQPEQRTKEWYVFRNNRLTASDFYSVIDKNDGAKINDLIQSKCGILKPFLTNAAILHGVKFEQIATDIYEKRNNLKILEFGCIPHATIPFFGASPDGIVSYDSNNKNYVGRMLEIKCPKSRKITGIIPDGYYAQIQGQLEVCDLELCDFLECDFQKHPTQEDFFNDNNPEKGAIIELYDTKLKKTLYYYSNDEVTTDATIFESWRNSIINTIFDEKNNHLEYLTTVYWYLNKLNVVLVKRDRHYFNTNYIKIKNFWDNVLKYRKIGIDKLETKSKKNVYSYKEPELNFID